jgi:hypothetical protein
MQAVVKRRGAGAEDLERERENKLQQKKIA